MFRVRRMRESDLLKVRDIERVSHPLPWRLAYFRQAVRRGWCCWVIEDAQTVAGYGVIQLVHHQAHIMSLTVAPHYRHRGLGIRMLRHLLREAGRQGARWARLEVRPSNQAALSLYGSLGFKARGYIRHYYPGPGASTGALVMTRRVQTGSKLRSGHG